MMFIRKHVDDLIAAGWRPITPDFGPVALQHWRRKVFDYMTAVHGRVTFSPDISKVAFAKARKGRVNMMEIDVPKRVSDMLKSTVENRHGEKLGTIHDIMGVGGLGGFLKYAILSHGGFLGIGDVLIPIPFDALMTGGEKGTAVLDMDKQTLEKALNFESKAWPDFTAAEWEEKVDRYFAAYSAGASQPRPA